ncbi:AraC family transcriptional regulator [Bacillus sp. NP157]|nr:AraC family transcriptional regulator [Bacillus sp. NP157]
MHLVAGIPASSSAPLGDHAGVGHLTPMDTGWLLGLVFEADDRRLVANHLVAAHEKDPSSTELASRMRALGQRLDVGSTQGSSAARHLRDAASALDAVLGKACPSGSTALSARQLDIAYGLLGSGLEKALYVSDVAAACGVSEGHFRRAFRLCTGISPQQWRQERRIRDCRRQLAEGDESLATIARRAGFTAQSHFSRVFSQLTGMSPSEWRRIVRPAARAANLGATTAGNPLNTLEAGV